MEARSEVLPRPFGKYTLLKLLASGGMGAVYLAASGSRGLEKLLAIKVVLPELAGPEFIRRFRDEAKVVVKLSHGNLVQVFDAGEVDGEAYLAMEFVDGADLRTIWNRCVERRVAFPVEVVIQVIKDALRGLSYAHRYEGLELIHRDISPPNIMVTRYGEVKVTDFGLALSSVKMEKTAPGLVFGKIPYMSPEQARGDKVDGRADLYPLGVILWELLTGRRLFPPSGEGRGDLTQRARGPKVPIPSSICSRVSPLLDDVVTKALAPKVEDRYRDAREMLRHLAQVQAKLWPGMDTDRVAAFMQTLFGEELTRNKRQREALLESLRESYVFEDEASKGGKSGASSTGDPGSASSSGLGGAASVSTTLSEEEAAPLLGGRYRLGRMLGEGGMGQVFEAEHTDIGRRVAVKILHQAFSRTPEALERFRREARATTTIGHPSIVDVLDFGVTDDGQCYYVMELLEGLSLADLLELSSQVEIRRAVAITLAICDAMGAAHRAGVVHRDLKPDNVMLMGDSETSTEIKVLDFGIARHTGPDAPQESLTRPGAALGTPEYMAPEQAAGEPVDSRADIYATCQILYKMLTGKTPHTGNSPQEVLLRKIQNPAQDIAQHRSDLPVSLCEVIMSGLESDPQKRPQSADQLVSMLSRVQEDFAPAATPSAPQSADPSSSSSSVPPGQISHRGASKKNVGLWILSGLFLGVISVATAWYLVYGRGHAPSANPPSDKKQTEAFETVGSSPLAAGNSEEEPRPGDPRSQSRKNGDLPKARGRQGEGGAGAGGAPTREEAPSRKASGDPSKTTSSPALSPAPDFRGASEPQTPDDASRSLSRTSSRTRARTRGTSEVSNPTTPAPRVSVSDLLSKGKALMASGDYSGASKVFTQAKNTPGGQVRGLNALAELAFQRGRHKKAVRLALKAIRSGGGNRARLILGNAYYKLGLYKSAVVSYKRILGRNPNHRTAKRYLKAAQKRLGQ